MRAILSGIKLFKLLKYICFVIGEIIESESDFLGSTLSLALNCVTFNRLLGSSVPRFSIYKEEIAVVTSTSQGCREDAKR